MTQKNKPGRKPLYLVKLGSGYYAGKRPWVQVSREEASRLTHRDVLRIRSLLNQPRIGYHASLEPA